MAEAWHLIEQTCADRFTGQLTLVTLTDTAVLTTNVHMTRGLIYLAEHTTDAPLAERLAAAGAIPVRLRDFLVGGPDEDIDALFQLDPTLSREPAEQAIQTSTEAVLVEIAAREVQSSTSTMHRHHPSGVDRWFSSQQARDDGSGVCHSSVDVGRPDRIVATPEPVSIPHLEVAAPAKGDDVDDVDDAVRRAIAAIDNATRTIGPAPKGYVRPSRPPVTSR